MDKDYFVQLVTGGYLERSGYGRETEHIVTWFRSGDFFKSSWRIAMGSPKAKALFRAYVWLIEILTVHNSFKPGMKCPSYYNCSMGLMEFNPEFLNAINAMIKDVFPISNQGMIYIFGIHKAIPVVWNIISKSYPETTSGVRCFDSFSDAVDLVTNAADIPDFWFSNEYDADMFRFKRTNVWCFERCLSDNNRVTTKDVYNPGPWPSAADECVDVSSSALTMKGDMNRDANGDAINTNVIDGLHAWFGRRNENSAPISRKLETRQLALNAIQEDDAESEDF